MSAIKHWFKEQGWKPLAFQKECWKAFAMGKNGMLHAPTGSGKTYALWGGILQESLKQKKHPVGIQALWITPLRALAVEIQQATQRMTNDLQPDLKIALRTGDTSQSERGKQKRKPAFCGHGQRTLRQPGPGRYLGTHAERPAQRGRTRPGDPA